MTTRKPAPKRAFSLASSLGAWGGEAVLRAGPKARSGSAFVLSALGAYARGEDQDALRLLDPVCAAQPTPETLLLRAAILRRLGAEALAACDERQATALEPDHPAILRARLRDPDASMEARLAMVSLAIRRDRGGRRPGEALEALADLPIDAIVTLHAAKEELLVQAWARKAGVTECALTIGDRQARVRLPFRQGGSAADPFPFESAARIPWPEPFAIARLRGVAPRVLVGRSHASRPFFQESERHARPPAAQARPLEPIAIVIPVYGDPDSLRVCLDCVLNDPQARLKRRVILVNDASPDPEIAALLAAYRDRPGVETITLPANRGFIGAVNVALTRVGKGDVVLLNSDAVVSEAWLEGLARHVGEGVGTITPLSNNGELVSFPEPFLANPMPDAQSLARLASHARAKPSLPVRLPNGIGFCMYVTQSCRGAVGAFNDADYEAGYLEELDFCLRASELGFTHLCAPDVFVGHWGSRSFKDSKRALVRRNQKEIARRFPAISKRTEAFLALDPLQPARLVLQRALLDDPEHRIAAQTAVVGAMALDYARLPEEEERVLRLRAGREGIVAHLEGAAAPCRLPLDGIGALHALLDRCALRRAFVLDAAPETLPIMTALRDRGVSLRLRLTDESWLRNPERLRALVANAEAIETASVSIARAFHALHGRQPMLDAPAMASADAPVARRGLRRIAVLIEAQGRQPLILLRETARRLQADKIPLTFCVLGRTCNDDLLWRAGNIAVIERPEPMRLPQALRVRDLDASLVFMTPGRHESALDPWIARMPAPLLIAGNAAIPDEARWRVSACVEALTQALLALAEERA